MNLVLDAPNAAKLIGAPTDRLVVEIYDPRFAAGLLHFCTGNPGDDGTYSVELDADRALVSIWSGGECDDLTFDRAAFEAALAADRIGVER